MYACCKLGELLRRLHQKATRKTAWLLDGGANFLVNEEDAAIELMARPPWLEKWEEQYTQSDWFPKTESI